jgi:hypothetical protein
MHKHLCLKTGSFYYFIGFNEVYISGENSDCAGLHAKLEFFYDGRIDQSNQGGQNGGEK